MSETDTHTDIPLLDVIHQPLQEEYLKMSEEVNTLTPDEQTAEYVRFVEIMQKSPDSNERNSLSLILSLLRRNHIFEDKTFCEFPYINKLQSIIDQESTQKSIRVF